MNSSLLDKYTTTCIVKQQIETGEKDPFNNIIYEYIETEHKDCLVIPLTSKEIIESTNLYGAKALYNVYFTKDLDLQGAKVEINGTDYSVVANPKPLLTESPNKWRFVVQIAKA